MKKLFPKFVSLLIAHILSMGLMAQTYSGGSGTSASPYQIATLTDLRYLSEHSTDWNKYFDQTDDIDASATSGWNSGAGFSPIGNETTKFTGSYDGQDYSISNLFIDRTTYLGLFGFIGESSGTDKGNITNLNLIDVDISGSGDYIGGLSGFQNISSAVENVHVSGTLTGSVNSNYVGGLMGEVLGNVTNCSFDGDVTGEYFVGGFIGGSKGNVTTSHSSGNVIADKEYTGGLIGRMSSGTVTKSYSTSNLSKIATYVFYAGGFVGGVIDGTISQCYSTGNVLSFRDYVGGFAGENEGEINNCFSTGKVTRNGGTGTRFGGFVGWNSGGDVFNCYSTGAVEYDNDTNPTDKGFAGYIDIWGSNEKIGNFWDTETSNQSSTYNSQGATGKTTIEMKDIATFTDETTVGLTTAWDFTGDPYDDAGTNDYWSIDGSNNNAYPWLTWQAYNPVSNNWQGDDGTSPTDWDVAANWELGTVPTVSNNVAVPDVSNDPVIGADVNASCNDLTVNSGATLTIESSSSGTGSLIVNGSATGDITVQRYIAELSRADAWHYVSASVSGQALNDTWMDDNNIATFSGQYQFYRWDEDTDYWIFYDYTGSEPEDFGDNTFVDARAYTLTATGNQALSFTGTVLTTNTNYAATYTENIGGGWNLVGNPFSSTIAITEDAQATDNFLADNAAIIPDSYEAIYVWDEQTAYTYGRDDYKVICNSGFSGEGSGSQISQDYVSPGQGFMVKVNTTGNIVFNEDIRKHGAADFYKEDESWPGIELGVAGNEQVNSTILAFQENMTKGLDPSYDAAKLKGNPDLALYTKLIEDNGKDFAIQALPYFKEEYSIPVGIDISEEGTYTFEVVKMEKIPEDVHIYLEDHKTGKVTNLKETSTYPCVLEESGSITDRFVLHFTLSPFGEEELQAHESPIQIRVKNKMINLYNPDHLKGTIKIFNLYGQQIRQAKLNGDRQLQIPLQAPTAYYLVTVVTEKGVISEKIFVY